MPPSAGTEREQVSLVQTPSWSKSLPAVLQEEPVAPMEHSFGGAMSAAARGAAARIVARAGIAKSGLNERRGIIVGSVGARTERMSLENLGLGVCIAEERTQFIAKWPSNKQGQRGYSHRARRDVDCPPGPAWRALV
jgi:hypothetical protein